MFKMKWYYCKRSNFKKQAAKINGQRGQNMAHPVECTLYHGWGLQFIKQRGRFTSSSVLSLSVPLSHLPFLSLILYLGRRGVGEGMGEGGLPEVVWSPRSKVSKSNKGHVDKRRGLGGERAEDLQCLIHIYTYICLIKPSLKIVMVRLKLHYN